jgi:3-hydroxybutyryl-CoA dehydrogenase
MRAGGFRMGPFELMDLIGIDVNFAVTQAVYQAFFGDARFRPHPIQQRMVEANRLGQKTGHGFYPYPDGPVRPEPMTGPRLKLALVGLPGTHQAERFADHDLVVVDATHGFPAEALDGVDLVLSTDLTRTANAQANRLGRPVGVVGHQEVAFSAGVTARLPGFHEVPDQLGLVFPRILAMLVNEAFFALGEGVATEADIDRALQLGANYPRGPIAWGKEQGLARVLALLDALRHELGEERYRAAPALRRAVETFQAAPSVVRA